MRSPRSTCRVEIVEHHELAVRLAYAFELEHGAAALGARRECEMNPLPLGRHLDRHHLLEQLDPALYLRGLGRLVPKAIDEELDASDFIVLLLLGLSEPFEPRVALVHVLRVAARIVVDRPERQVGDARHDGIEKEAIVADEDDRMRILVQVPRASSARRDPDDSSARPAAAGRVGRAAAWPARGASATRPRTPRSGVRDPPARTRDRAAPSRPAGRCCNRRRCESGPADRCSAPGSPRARSREPCCPPADARGRASRSSCPATAGMRSRPLPARCVRRDSGHPAAGSRRVRPDGLSTPPLSGSSSPAIILSSVVLPAPFGPHSPTHSRSEICHVTLSSRTRSPNDLVRPES